MSAYILLNDWFLDEFTTPNSTVQTYDLFKLRRTREKQEITGSIATGD
jgi:hypothetical protein